MPDRFTAEELRALAKDRPGVIGPMLLQAADTEEMVERIASAEPALVEEVLSQNEDGKWDKHLVRAFLIALAAVLKGEAHE